MSRFACTGISGAIIGLNSDMTDRPLFTSPKFKLSAWISPCFIYVCVCIFTLKEINVTMKSHTAVPCNESTVRTITICVHVEKQKVTLGPKFPR